MADHQTEVGAQGLGPLQDGGRGCPGRSSRGELQVGQVDDQALVAGHQRAGDGGVAQAGGGGQVEIATDRDDGHAVAFADLQPRIHRREPNARGGAMAVTVVEFQGVVRGHPARALCVARRPRHRWPARPPRDVARPVRPLRRTGPTAAAGGASCAGRRRVLDTRPPPWTSPVRGSRWRWRRGRPRGKSLCFRAPIAEAVTRPDRPGTALLVFPTKALARDQLRAFTDLGLPGLVAAAYDGDCSTEERAWVRKHANVVLTNPEMLHNALLPNHGKWATFLLRLRFVVVDELHAFRGVFGSHVAHVLRRLRRVAAFHRG